MEASAAAGQAGGDGAAQGEGEGTADQQQGPDVAALAEQLGSLSSSQEAMREALQQIQQSPALREQAEAVEEQHPGIDLSFLNEADPFDPEALKTAMESVAQQTRDQVLQEHVAPLAERLDGMQFEQDAARLFAEFPELGDPEVAEPLLKPGGLAEQMAMELGLPEQAAKDLAAKPAFVRLAYMASRAAAAAQEEEGAESPAAAHLEGGSGARPGAQQVDLGDQIVGAARGGSSVLPFG